MKKMQNIFIWLTKPCAISITLNTTQLSKKNVTNIFTIAIEEKEEVLEESSYDYLKAEDVY